MASPLLLLLQALCESFPSPEAPNEIGSEVAKMRTKGDAPLHALGCLWPILSCCRTLVLRQWVGVGFGIAACFGLLCLTRVAPLLLLWNTLEFSTMPPLLIRSQSEG